ncbi:substance-P receptor-like [Oculina patagonica]
MHTTTNYLLVSLAVADVITIALGPIYTSSLKIGSLSNGLGNCVCKLSAFMDISVAVSSFTLTVLAVERYHALLKPLRTRLQLTEDNIKQAIALTWIISFIICLPATILIEWRESLSTCVGPFTLHMNKASKIQLIIETLFSTYLPLTVVTYCYGSLIKGLYITNTICAEPVTSEESGSEKKKLVITCILATAGLFICLVPIVVFYTFVVPKPDEQVDLKLYSDLSAVFSFLFLFSLCFNPVLYAFQSTSFRDGFKRIIFGCRRNQNNNVIELQRNYLNN